MKNLSTAAATFSQPAIPVSAGVGLRGPHMIELEQTQPKVGWLEVHSENFFGDGGSPIHYLMKIRQNYPISLHGVGLSLGSSDPLNRQHLADLQRLIDWVEPGLISEHLSWGSIDGVYFNDLLPLPYTEEALAYFCERVLQVQDNLRRTILIENPSNYLRYRHSVIPEAEFLTQICQRTGAGLLLDVNNIFVSAFNLGFDPVKYIASIPGDYVAEIHLAGHTEKSLPDGMLLIDDHASKVSRAVWDLYALTLESIGIKPTLIEWDTSLPALDELLAEAATAQQFMDTQNASIA